MKKLTASEKTKIKSAISLIQKAAEILGDIETNCGEMGNHEMAANLEEIGISLGFSIDQIDENILN